MLGHDQRVVGLLLGEDDRPGVLDHLLGDGGGALDDGSCLEVGVRRPGDGLHVDPVVGPERLILAGDRGVDDDVRDLVEANRFAVLALESGEENRSGSVVHEARLRQRHVVEQVRIGQAGGEVVVGQQRAGAGAQHRTADQHPEEAEDDDERKKEGPGAESRAERLGGSATADAAAAWPDASGDRVAAVRSSVE